MNRTQQETREEARHEVRRYLAERCQLAFRDSTIQRALVKEHGLTLDDVRDALVYLISAGDAEATQDGDGATMYYKVTSKGILVYERSL